MVKNESTEGSKVGEHCTHLQCCYCLCRQTQTMHELAAKAKSPDTKVSEDDADEVDDNDNNDVFVCVGRHFVVPDNAVNASFSGTNGECAHIAHSPPNSRCQAR